MSPSKIIRKLFRLKCVFFCFAALFSVLFFTTASAGPSLDGIQLTIESSGGNIIGIAQGTAITFGIVCMVASVFKFYRWKQNPQQISVGQGISLAMIGVVMIALPLTISSTAKALFGDAGSADGPVINHFGDNRLANIVVPQQSDSKE